MTKILEIAILEIGTVELPADSNTVKYNTWFYNKEVSGKQYPWCGTFVSWVFFMAKLPLGRIDFLKGFAGCPYAVKNVKKWGRLFTVPNMGDVVFYDWQGDGIFDHTGIFEKDLGGGLFAAIEGNTAFGNDSNGGKVMRRSDRKYKNAIFVRPKVLEKV
jgi:hypothetical protein